MYLFVPIFGQFYGVFLDMYLILFMFKRTWEQANQEILTLKKLDNKVPSIKITTILN